MEAEIAAFKPILLYHILQCNSCVTTLKKQTTKHCDKAASQLLAEHKQRPASIMHASKLEQASYSKVLCCCLQQCVRSWSASCMPASSACC